MATPAAGYFLARSIGFDKTVAALAAAWRRTEIFSKRSRHVTHPHKFIIHGPTSISQPRSGVYPGGSLMPLWNRSRPVLI